MTDTNDDFGTELTDPVTDAGVATPAEAPAPETPPASAQPPAPAEPAPALGGADDANNDNAIPDWMKSRINKLHGQREAEREGRLAAEAELARLRAGQPQPTTPTDGAQPATPTVPAPARTYTEAEVRAEAERIANARVADAQRAEATRTFNERCDAVFNEGSTKYGDAFKVAIANLNMAGVVSPTEISFVQDALRTENPAAVLKFYGENPGDAERVAGLDPVSRALEMDRLSRKVGQDALPAPTPVSRAPAPIVPVSGDRPSGDVDLYDDNVDDTAWFAARQRQRAARG